MKTVKYLAWITALLAGDALVCRTYAQAGAPLHPGYVVAWGFSFGP